jgi:cytidyltransferase-like protein
MNPQSVGLIIGAFKPYTKGHHFLVETAARENEFVHLFVSQKDRKRKGEVPITWSKMEVIWHEFIEPMLPKNVIVHYSENPLVSVYNFLKSENDSLSKKSYTLYADNHDKARYCYEDKQIEAKFPFLYMNHSINVKTYERSENIDVSGTKMRKTLQTHNFNEFTKMLPDSLVIEAQKVFELLLADSSVALPSEEHCL